MPKVIYLACASIFFVLFAVPQDRTFSKYRVIEAFEVRPGVLMMPKHSRNGEVCEIGLEKLHYSLNGIDLDWALSRGEITQILRELVPPNERGPRSKLFGGELISRAGLGLTTSMDFERVLIRIYGRQLPGSHRGEIVTGDIVATIHWKDRECQ